MPSAARMTPGRRLHTRCNLLKCSGMERSQINLGSTFVKEEAATTQEFINPLPRAVMRSTFHQLLDGEWRFALDLDDRGLREAWYLGHVYDRTALWPGLIEAHMSEAKELQQ